VINYFYGRQYPKCGKEAKGNKEKNSISGPPISQVNQIKGYSQKAAMATLSTKRRRVTEEESCLTDYWMGNEGGGHQQLVVSYRKSS